MKFLRAVNIYTRLDRFRNVEVRVELNIKNLNSRIDNCRTKWKEYTDRMPAQRLLHQVRRYMVEEV